MRKKFTTWMVDRLTRENKQNVSVTFDTVGFTTLDVVSLGWWCCKNWLVIASKNFRFCNGMECNIGA